LNGVACSAPMATRRSATTGRQPGSCSGCCWTKGLSRCSPRTGTGHDGHHGST